MQALSSPINSAFLDFAKDSLPLAAAAVGLTAIAYPFVEKKNRPKIIKINGIFLIMSLASKKIMNISSDEVETLGREKFVLTLSKIMGQKNLFEFYNYSHLLLFSIIDDSTRVALFHEAGHYLAAKLLYESSISKITITPFGGASYTYSSQTLSKIGNIFGKDNSNILTIAAGPFAQTLLAVFDLGLSHLLKEWSPPLSVFFTISAISNIFNQFVYAFSPLVKKNLEKYHDFFQLWKKGGIHPLVSCSLTAGFPYFVNKFVLSRLGN